jgi:hypothetical protein
VREEERQARRKLGSIIAAIDAELVAVKEALDKLSDKTAWLRWLKDQVHYSMATAENYMRVARSSQKKPQRCGFFRSGSQCSAALKERTCPSMICT